MMKNILLFGLTLGILAFWGKTLHAQFSKPQIDDLEKPVVVELFTSQSCSSCPPADKHLAKLGENPNIIPLSFHVTYWNHLHWKDTLSRDFSTDRQRAYARFKGGNRVYTPQMIVNGDDEFVGSNAHKINSALKRADPVQKIRMTDTDGFLNIEIPDFPKHTSRTQTFWLFGIKDKHVQDIPSGENKGRNVTYHNAVLEQMRIDRSGQIRSFKIQNPNWNDIDALVLIAQEKPYGEIIAAGKLK